MNLILESSARVPYFTDMGACLKAAGIAVEDFDWYVSDCETNVTVPELSGGSRWFDGDELSRVLETDHLQFDWGVFSAVPRGMRYPVESDPFADGNPAYWQAGDIVPQLPGALFEIACWDSSATILVGLSREHAAAFLAAFPEAMPLSRAAIGR